MFLWEKEFSLAWGQKAAFNGEANCTMRSVVHAVTAWIEMLYALNEEFVRICRTTECGLRAGSLGL